jgi:hypothetical protein
VQSPAPGVAGEGGGVVWCVFIVGCRPVGVKSVVWAGDFQGRGHAGLARSVVERGRAG